MRPSHVQSQKHLQKEWPNSPKAHTWSMAFCCSDFNVQMHKPLLHDSPRAQSTDELLYQSKPRPKITSQPNTEAPQCHWCPPLVLKEFKIQISTNFTMRPSYDQGKIHLQKSCFLDIWSYDDEKKNLSKWIGWMEARWMSFSFELNTHHSWYLPWHQKQALFLTWKRALDPRLPTETASETYWSKFPNRNQVMR